MRSTPYQIGCHMLLLLLAVSGFATCLSQRSVQALCLSVLSAFSQGSKENFQKTYKNSKKNETSKWGGGKKGENKEKRLCQRFWRENPGNENLRSRKRRFGSVSKGGSWDSHKNKNMVIWTLEKTRPMTESQRRERMQLQGSAGRSLGKQQTHWQGRWGWNERLNSGKYGQLG